MAFIQVSKQRLEIDFSSSFKLVSTLGDSIFLTKVTISYSEVNNIDLKQVNVDKGCLLYQACFLFNPFKPTWYLRGIQQIVFARLIWRKGIGGWCTKSNLATDWESKPRWKCNFTITGRPAFLITAGQAKVSKDRKAGLQVDFSSSALSILQDFWSLVLVFMEFVKVNVAAVAWGLRNCMQVKTRIQNWPADCDQKKMAFSVWPKKIGSQIVPTKVGL